MELSLTAFAESVGVRHSAIQKAIRTGRIKSYRVEAKGKTTRVFIDVERGRAEYIQSSDPAQKIGMQRAGKKVIINAVDGEPGSEGAEQAPGKVSTFIKNKTAKSGFDAKLAQLEYEEKSNQVIRVAVVKKHWATIAEAIKARLMGIPSRIGSNIAACYKASIDQLMVRITAGEQITPEILQQFLSAVLSDKKSLDLIDGEIRNTLEALSSGDAFLRGTP